MGVVIALARLVRRALLEGEAAGDPERALAAIATCVGGVALARCIADDDLVETLLDACKKSVSRELGRTG